VKAVYFDTFFEQCKNISPAAQCTTHKSFACGVLFLHLVGIHRVLVYIINWLLYNVCHISFVVSHLLYIVRSSWYVIQRLLYNVCYLSSAPLRLLCIVGLYRLHTSVIIVRCCISFVVYRFSHFMYCTPFVVYRLVYIVMHVTVVVYW